MKSKEKMMLTIRPANLADAQSYSGHLCTLCWEKTAITFEYEVPSVQEFENRINKTLETYLLIWSLKRMDKFSDMPMLQPTMPGHIIGQLVVHLFALKTPVVEVWGSQLYDALEEENLNNGAFCDS